MSQPNWGRPFALAIILCTFGGFVYWHEFRHKPIEEEQTEQTKKPFHIKNVTVRTVRVKTANYEVTFDCLDLSTDLCKPGENSKWQMVSPTQAKAEDASVDPLLTTMETLIASDTIGLKEETPAKRAALLKGYGLDPAELAQDRQLQFDTPKGTVVLYLGLTHPIGDGIFAAVEKTAPGVKPVGKIDDSTIYLLPSYVKGIFDRDLAYWRDKKVLPLLAHEVEGFTLKNSKGEITGERKAGIWTLRSKNEDEQGDLDAMDTLLAGVTGLVAKDFVSDDKKDAKARAALSGAQQVASIALKKEKVDQPIVLTLYKKVAGKPPAKGVVQYRVFATVSNLDPLFEVESYAKERLDKTLLDLRLSKLITPMDRFGAKRLEFSSTIFGTSPWTLANKDGKWAVDGHPSETVNAEKIQGFLDHLTAAKIQLFVTKDMPKPSAEALTFTLGDDSNPQKRKVVFWRELSKLGQKLYAKDLLSQRNEVFLMDNSLTAEIPWDKAKLK
jgi:hypothetical protein